MRRVQGSIQPLGLGDALRVHNEVCAVHHGRPWHVLLILPLTRQFLSFGFVQMFKGTPHTQLKSMYLLNVWLEFESLRKGHRGGYTVVGKTVLHSNLECEVDSILGNVVFK